MVSANAAVLIVGLGCAVDLTSGRRKSLDHLERVTTFLLLKRGAREYTGEALSALQRDCSRKTLQPCGQRNREQLVQAWQRK